MKEVKKNEKLTKTISVFTVYPVYSICYGYLGRAATNYQKDIYLSGILSLVTVGPSCL